MARVNSPDFTAAIIAANAVVWDNIFERGTTVNAKFTRFGKKIVNFEGLDPITGVSYSGSYFLNNKATVSRYDVFFWSDSIGGLTMDVGLNGARSAFAQHTSSLSYLLETREPSTMSALEQAFLGNGQGFANLLDQIPGANRLDPSSTYVSSGAGQSWWA